ncbi:MAG: M20/M25/M40 family metallo-hydrolase [Acidobacteria bacterium]|nr:M20/M25/M40 family metallo-hydrolase [Acidobacteriota bacterium]
MPQLTYPRALFARALVAAVLVFNFAAHARNARAQAATDEPHKMLLRDIYKELVEINTTDSVGDCTRAAQAMAARLRAAGFPAEDVQVLVPEGNAKKGNLVARLRGTGAKKPVLLLAHIDVVEARRDDWSTDPFKLTEQDGYLYGRGTTDDKAMAAIFVTNMIRMKTEGIKPERDIILALTADEEGGDYNGASFLIKNHRELVDAEFGINEGAGGQSKRGRKLLNGVQSSEKVYQSFRLEVTNPGGHSSQPRKDNAIYQLAAALLRVGGHEFPFNLNETTRAYFERMSKIETGQLAADMKAVANNPPDPAAVARLSETPYYNALMRTTCVATRLEGGHADNALPQVARALVNCRILPQENATDTEAALVRAINDPKVKITPVGDFKPSPPSPLTSDVMHPVERVTEMMWHGVPVVPLMGTGATDSLYFRQAGVRMYGVSGIFGDIEDNRAHGRDERIQIKALYEAQEFLYELVKAFASGR